MNLTVSLEQLKKTKLTPDQFVLINLIYHQKFDDILEIFGKEKAMGLRSELSTTDYILSIGPKFMDTVISKKHVERLLDIRGDVINFWEFYNCYPIKVGSRVLRSAGPTSQLALKHEKKYLARVKKLEDHQQAIKAVNAFVNKQRQSQKLAYLPNMETVLNNASWEQWAVFIEDEGVEGQEWNNNLI